MKEVLSKADAGVAGGCSGWRNEHFKGAAETDLGLAALATIMLAMAQGDCGSPYSENGNMHVWDASRLIALVKGDEWTGAENTRPIAIGETLRRLTGKCLLRARRDVIERRALTIRNFAFTSDGCSNVVKLVQLYTHEHPDHVVLTTDVETAFQSAPRTQMERALYEDEGLRPLLPYFYSLYADEAALYFGDDVLKSREGCQQGCTLGTLLYVLSILPVILQLMDEFPDCMILGSSDDYYICGPPEEAAACLRRYGVLLAERDQRLKFSKSWAYSASAAALTHADIVALHDDLQVRLTARGIGVLGSPVGNGEFTHDFVMTKVRKNQELLREIEALGAHDNAAAAHR